MGDPEHVAILKAGLDEWHAWRQDNPRLQPDLTRIDLSEQDLRGADLRGVGLFKANLAGCDLRESDLRQARIVQTNLSDADISGSRVYGVSVWEANLTRTKQQDLLITRDNEPELRVDRLAVAQFVHLLLQNERFRDVIDTMTSKTVLLLGRFTPERKPILEELRNQLREWGYLPMLFDFEGPRSRNITETVSTLSHLARFVIADLTSPASVPFELGTIIPRVKVPVAAFVEPGKQPFGMYSDLQEDRPWILPVREVGGTDVEQGQALRDIIRDLEHASRQIGK